MIQSLSVSCKLQVPDNVRPTIDRTMAQFADACNQILVAAQLHKCYNATKLHHLIYRTVREATGLKANHVCQAIRRVLGNLKATKKIRMFRPTSVSLDTRTFVYHPDSQEVGIKCGHCSFEHDADLNAAINIAQLGVVYVNQPEIPGITCLARRTTVFVSKLVKSGIKPRT